MKNTFVLLGVSVLIMASCQNQKKPNPVIDQMTPQQDSSVSIPEKKIVYPDDLQKVFEAHGGVLEFQKHRTLEFELVNKEGNEKHITDLWSRKARIETDKFTLGFDGKEAWLEQDSTYFKGNPRFYHNLMFYFYAMPFVLGDEGIKYEKVEDLEVEGIKYSGYKISYQDGIGDSPKDNYFMYYDKSNHQMKFLGYTVTFFSKESSKKISLIEYSDWQKVGTVLLPKTLKWRTYKDGKVGEIKSERQFQNATIGKQSKSSETYQKPEDIENIEESKS